MSHGRTKGFRVATNDIDSFTKGQGAHRPSGGLGKWGEGASLPPADGHCLTLRMTFEGELFWLPRLSRRLLRWLLDSILSLTGVWCTMLPGNTTHHVNHLFISNGL